MSSEDSYLQSGRQSSDGTMSENATSDGAHTAMTSIMDTDEEELAEELEVDEEEDDMISIYPPSHYPRPVSTYRTEMPYSSEDPAAPMSDMAASTRSLWAQDLDYRDIHGRRYCREYFMPNDEIEQMRLALQHQVFIHVLEGELTLAPIQDPTHILDVGTGTGEWAIKMAEILPHCEVVGTDISAIAETRSVPMNVFFEIEDAEDWDRHPEQYDLIHFRCMEGAFQNWRFIYDSVFFSLKPGGWVEVQDFDSAEGFSRFVDQFPPDSPMITLNRDLAEAAEKSGRPRGTGHLDPRLFMEAGFVDIRVTEYVIPITVAERSAGKIWLISCLDALEANCLRLLTTYMGWDPEKCKAACEAAAREMANLAKDPEKSRGLQVKMRVVVARKPLDAPPSDMPPSPFERTSSPSSEMVVDEGSPDPTLRAADEESLEPEQPAKDVNINGPAPTSTIPSTEMVMEAEVAQPGPA
ncbi:Fc.00g076670.m01.CDS01 [Cosmosporella sp. VM-42]